MNRKGIRYDNYIVSDIYIYILPQKKDSKGMTSRYHAYSLALALDFLIIISMNITYHRHYLVSNVELSVPC